MHVTRLSVDGTDSLPENGLLQFAWDEIPAALPMTWTQNANEDNWTWKVSC